MAGARAKIQNAGLHSRSCRRLNERKATVSPHTRLQKPEREIMIGNTILHCHTLAKLGEGGAGVVYKAEDAKFEPVVAIKFLPHHIAANAEERERFKIETQAAAALNHPNIATIYLCHRRNR